MCIYKFNRFLRKFHFHVKFLSSCSNDFLTSFHFRLHRIFLKKKRREKGGTSFTKNLIPEGLSRMTSKNEKPSLFFSFFPFLPFFRRRPIYVFVSPVSARMTRPLPPSWPGSRGWFYPIWRGMHAPLFGCIDRLFRYYANKRFKQRTFGYTWKGCEKGGGGREKETIGRKKKPLVRR